MASTERLFAVVEELRDRNGARVTELADTLDMPDSTVHRHLKTLHEMEYVTKFGDEYHISTKFLHVGSIVRYREEAYSIAQDKIKDLSEATGERAQFQIEEHGRIAYVYRETGRQAVRTDSHIGKRMPMHATSGGKAILAEMTDDRVEEILDRHGLPQLTTNTITDRAELYDELEQIRSDGVSYNDQEYIEGLRAVAVPIKKSDRHVFGAIGISGPSHRLKGDVYRDELPDLLLGAANEIELNLEFSDAK